MVGMALNTAIQLEGLGRERGIGQSRGLVPLLVCPLLSSPSLHPCPSVPCGLLGPSFWDSTPSPTACKMFAVEADGDALMSDKGSAQAAVMWKEMGTRTGRHNRLFSAPSLPAPTKRAEMRPLGSFWQQHAVSLGSGKRPGEDLSPAFAPLTHKSLLGSAVLSGSRLLHIPGGDLHRHKLLVRPDVLDDDDGCDIPRANHAQRAARGDRKPISAPPPSPEDIPGSPPSTSSPILLNFGLNFGLGREMNIKGAATVFQCPAPAVKLHPGARWSVPSPTWRTSGSRSPWGWRGAG